MEFEGCVSSYERNICKQLLTTKANFEPYPHERMIRLALSQSVGMPLNLTIQHGPCNISCEGGSPNSCATTKEDDHFWPDTSTPYYLRNCTPSHYYCVTASIGECCPVCTDTIFMPDFQEKYYYEDKELLNSQLIMLMIFIFILISISFVAILKNYFNFGLKSRKQKYKNIVSIQQTQHILEIEEIQPTIKVVCLYLKENNPLFIEMVNTVQAFLKRKSFNVIDIYDEEENINQSVSKWVQTVIKEGDSKILLFDSVRARQLWNGASDHILKPVEQVFHFTRSCIPLTQVHSSLFVIRFQGSHHDTKSFIDLSDGRCYVYPVHRERLAHDLKINSS